MSAADPADQQPPSFRVCTQCAKEITSELAEAARHSIPCGHLVCGDCSRELVSDQEEKKGVAKVCKDLGCESTFQQLGKWPKALCAHRPVKAVCKAPEEDATPHPTCSQCKPDAQTGKPHLATHRCDECKDAFCESVASLHAKMRASRGHAVAPITGGPKRWDICAVHCKPVRFTDVGSLQLLCVSCVSASPTALVIDPLSASLALLQQDEVAAGRALANLQSAIGNLEQHQARLGKWVGDETARIHEWEEREINAVHAIAEKAIALVEEVRTFRTTVGESILRQRKGLAASLQEAARMLNYPADAGEAGEQLPKLLALSATRKELLAQLAKGDWFVPEDKHAGWVTLPTLAEELSHSTGLFRQQISDTEIALARALNAARLTPWNRVRLHGGTSQATLALTDGTLSATPAAAAGGASARSAFVPKSSATPFGGLGQKIPAARAHAAPRGVPASSLEGPSTSTRAVAKAAAPAFGEGLAMPAFGAGAAKPAFGASAAPAFGAKPADSALIGAPLGLLGAGASPSKPVFGAGSGVAAPAAAAAGGGRGGGATAQWWDPKCFRTGKLWDEDDGSDDDVEKVEDD